MGVYLPSPMGDAILSTPALKALRGRFASAHITLLGNKVARGLLMPGPFGDDWLDTGCSTLSLVRAVGRSGFDVVVLFKNSFESALVVRLAGIPHRVGYSREWRGVFLTDRLDPPRDAAGRYAPEPMVDYYLRLAEHLGCETSDRTLELPLDSRDGSSLYAKLPALARPQRPLVILVPGGAFGPSKCWPAERFAQTADRLVEGHNALVVISVAPDPKEAAIAQAICRASNHELHNLAQTPLTLGELKSLFAEAQLVITNDTGPRHIAIALGRPVITLFGPNNPAWTQTGYGGEVRLVGTGPCVPCDKPRCRQDRHYCMDSITVEAVCEEAERMLTGGVS